MRLLLAALALAVALAVALGGPHARHRPQRTGRGACVELTTGPSRLYACEDGRAYLVALGAWRDVGPLSPVPSAPKD